MKMFWSRKVEPVTDRAVATAQEYYANAKEHWQNLLSDEKREREALIIRIETIQKQTAVDLQATYIDSREGGEWLFAAGTDLDVYRPAIIDIDAEPGGSRDPQFQMLHGESVDMPQIPRPTRIVVHLVTNRKVILPVHYQQGEVVLMKLREVWKGKPV